MAKTISVYIQPNVEEELKLRGDNRSAVINRDLERLYSLYHRSLVIDLSLDEVKLIIDAMNGALYDTRSAPLLYASIEDACKLDGLDEKWGVDGPALVEKLKSLSTIQCLAIIDAAERFWQSAPTSQSTEEFEALIKEAFQIR